ncbi:MAG: bifunctional phosphopantothenoylcysteine decarboxylase/phosphopantothenate--cysteine ligase CoaBC [Ginsengibacter sp.]
MLSGKKILLCITGSIAAYKSVFLLRLFIQANAEVKVVMTNAAKDFISPLTFSTLSKNKVLSDLFESDTWSDHVALGRWADMILVAPASCNTIARMSHGICDNLLLATYFSATAPVMVAPAMDEDMWQHPTTKKNIQILRDNGNKVLDVDRGELASGLYGPGRMAEPKEIFELVKDFFFAEQKLKGKKALVTAGPTYESIDPVRFIGNHSTGKMGIAIAQELCRQGADVHLVLGPSALPPPRDIKTIRVVSAEEMFNASMNLVPDSDIVVMAAAVADFRATNTANQKIKKSSDVRTIELSPTKDILKSAGKIKTPKQILVGFALETENAEQNALKKLKEKNADLIILNQLDGDGAGFGYDTNKITIFGRNGVAQHFEKKAKKEVAKDIVKAITTYQHV